VPEVKHATFLTSKMTVFDAIFDANSSIVKLHNLFGHFDKKGTLDFKKI